MTRAALTVLGVVLAACGGDSGEVEVPLERSGPLGSLRDLVLYQGGAQGPYFLDRFEVTQGDWGQWLADLGRQPSDPVRDWWGGDRPPAEHVDRPMALVTLAEARAFARWRLCRLPRWDEWAHAASGRGQFQYPWGGSWSSVRANTAEFGLFAPTLVGTFEGGRQGDGPYDLLGNVSEWSESIPADWYGEPSPAWPFGGASRHLAHVESVRQHPAVRPWLFGPVPLPGILIHVDGAGRPPRLVVGADFGSPVEGGSWPNNPPPGRARWGGDRSERTGLRVATTPDELLRGLLEFEGTVSGGQRGLLRHFLRVPGHAVVMRSAWARARASAVGEDAASEMQRLLQRELGR